MSCLKNVRTNHLNVVQPYSWCQQPIVYCLLNTWVPLLLLIARRKVLLHCRLMVWQLSWIYARRILQFLWLFFFCTKWLIFIDHVFLKWFLAELHVVAWPTNVTCITKNQTVLNNFFMSVKKCFLSIITDHFFVGLHWLHSHNRTFFLCVFSYLIISLNRNDRKSLLLIYFLRMTQHLFDVV